MTLEPEVKPQVAAPEASPVEIEDKGFDLREELIEIGEAGKELLESINRNRESLFKATKDSLRNARDKVTRSANQVLRKADQALDTMAVEPFNEMTFKKKVAREALALAPIVGRSREFADARVRYRYAESSENNVLKGRARRDGFYAMIGVGFDVTTLGVGLIGRSAALATRSPAIASFLQQAIKLPLLGPVGRVVKIPGLRSLSPLVDELMKNKFASSVMDKLLSSRAPEEIASEIAEAELQ